MYTTLSAIAASLKPTVRRELGPKSRHATRHSNLQQGQNENQSVHGITYSILMLPIRHALPLCGPVLWRNGILLAARESDGPSDREGN